MTFSSLTFVFIFLPVILLLVRFIPGRGKLVVMFLSGLVFYAWGNPKMLLLLLLSIALHYITGLELDYFDNAGNILARKIVMVVTVLIDVAVLSLFKYTSLPFPVGLSFYTFSELSYLFDVYRDKAPAARNPFTLALYVSFFPKVTSGPIVQYAGFEKQLRELHIEENDLGAGLFLFGTGLMKKVLLADALGAAFSQITALPAMAGATAWLGAIFYSLQLYFDFSGYSDMAIGISRCFGFRFEKNFDHPYMSKNIAEFWRRWHISLGAWFRDYVYIPLGGNRVPALAQLRNLLVVWLLTGIWHGSNWNFVLWGLYHGAFVILERFVIKKNLDFLPGFVRILITDFIAVIGWVFFFSPSMGSALGYLGQMFGADKLGFFNHETWFFLKQNLLLLIVSIVLCGPLVSKLHDRVLYERWGHGRKIMIGIYAAAFVLCLAAMVSATYSSFLYFQF